MRDISGLEDEEDEPEDCFMKMVSCCCWELVASNPEPRNWKGLMISILVILSVILMVGLAVYWMTPPDPGPRVKGERIRLDQILEDRFKPATYNATFVGRDLVYMNWEGGLSVLSVEGGSRSILDNSTFRTLNCHKYSIDERLEHVMLIHEIQSVFRHSTTAKYTIQNIKDRTSPLLRLGVNTRLDILQEQESLQFAAFKSGGGVVFVSRNDIYYLDAIPDGQVHRITSSGAAGTVYNGVADWLYEEEILGQTEAIWISSAGTRMLYATFNDSNVELVTIREYGNSNSKGFSARARTREKSFRYPMAGAENPVVQLSVYTFTGEGAGKSVKVTPPADLKKMDHYFISGKWISEDRICILWMNRAQNTSFYTLCTQPDFVCKQILVEKSSDTSGAGWVEHWGIPVFSKDESQMIKIHPIREAEAGYFPQLVLMRVSTTDILPAIQLSQGRFQVTEILGWDQTIGLLYYMATLEGKPGERHFFSINVTSSAEERKPRKLTTDACLYNKIHLSPTFETYVQECLGPDIPYTVMYSLPYSTRISELESNQRLHKQVQVSSMPKLRYLSVPLPGSSINAQVKLTLPPVLRETEDYKFPLIVNVYGGPGTQTVDQRWGVGWDTYLASKRNFIVAQLDVRGSGFQGFDFLHAVKGKLGTLETQDVLKVVRYLVSNLKYIDKSKVCVWGWSYGGYLSARILAEDGKNGHMGRSKVFACGISVAPVTEWQSYDSAYTEKYMGLPTPQENWKGYAESSLNSKLENIWDNTYLVLHGTADDNVHIHHTMQLSKVLVQNHIIFRQQIYPDENHGLYGVIKHQHETMEAFIDDVFGPIEDFFIDDYFMAAANLLHELREESKMSTKTIEV